MILPRLRHLQFNLLNVIVVLQQAQLERKDHKAEYEFGFAASVSVVTRLSAAELAVNNQNLTSGF